MLCTYEDQKKDVLKLVGSGEGGLEALKQALRDDAAGWGYCALGWFVFSSRHQRTDLLLRSSSDTAPWGRFIAAWLVGLDSRRGRSTNRSF